MFHQTGTFKQGSHEVKALGGISKPPKPIYVALLLPVAAFLLISACAAPSETAGSAQGTADAQQTQGVSSASEPTKLAKGFQDFQIQVYKGEEILGARELQFAHLFTKGKPVVLNLFAGLCPPCRAEMPDVQSVSLQYKDKALIFGLDIGPFVGLGSREDGKALVRQLGVTYPTGSTSDSSVVRAYQVVGMPTTVFFTPDGRIHKKWTGLLTRAKLAELTEDLLKVSGG